MAEFQIAMVPVAAIVAIGIIFVCWKVLKFALKKIFGVLGVIAGIAVVLYPFIFVGDPIFCLLIGLGIIFASLAGFL